MSDLNTLKEEFKKVREERKAILAAYEESIAKTKGLMAEKKANQAKLNELAVQIKAAKDSK